MIVAVEVTKEDVEKGKIRNCFYCPIALAINRVLKTDFVSDVYPERFYVRDRSLVERACSARVASWDIANPVPLPDVATKFVKDFDHLTGYTLQLVLADFHNFSFDLDVPQEYLR